MNLIFDFDGTLVDSVQCAMDTFNLLAEKFNFRKVNQGEVHVIRDLSSKELIQYFEIPLYKLPQIILQARAHMRDKIQVLEPVAKLQVVLQQLHKEGFSLGILTSNSIENVETWLKQNEMQQLFNFIYSESNYFGKTRVLKKILKKYKIDKTKAFYIGDETRDIEAAKRCNIFSIAVTWGFNSEQVLSGCHPHYLIRQPEDLLEILR